MINYKSFFVTLTVTNLLFPIKCYRKGGPALVASKKPFALVLS